MYLNRKSFLSFAVSLLLFGLFPSVALAAGSDSAAPGGAFNMSVAYGITSAAALLLLVGYRGIVKKKNTWLFLLFVSVLVVNIGYLLLALSKTLGAALMANRIAYLGSVCLPLCMLMTIFDACRISYRKWLPAVLLCVSAAVFLLAASPGYLTCYYSDVSLVFINGMAKLEKVYGPLHSVYLVYLVVYFGMMIGVIFTSVAKKRVVSQKHAILLLTIVLLNIAIWFVEQLVYTEFEFLSVSYIVSELLLLMLYGMLQDYGILTEGAAVKPVEVRVPEERSARLKEEQIAYLAPQWSAAYGLTARESEVLVALLHDKRRKEIAADLCVTEHTIKKHTNNVFSKLAVSSRAELFEKAKME